MNVADYPFTLEAAVHVKKGGYGIEDLLEKRAFLPVRRRAAERILGAIGEGITPGYSHPEVELLSYPLARVMVSCIGDSLLIRRYALAEAKLAFQRMAGEEDLVPLARDLGFDPVRVGEVFVIHFTEYVSAAARMRSPKWKLVNGPLKGGYISVGAKELRRLMEEKAREKVLKGLPRPVDEKVCERLQDLLRPVEAALQAAKARDRVDLGKVVKGAFPPCINVMLAQLSEGANLAHTARFALTSFLLRINMSVDDVVGVFNTSPDFDEERTRYQVEHIAGSSGTRYKPPSCSTMATYGNCPGEDDLCRRIRHPLGYYERRLRALPRKA